MSFHQLVALALRLIAIWLVLAATQIGLLAYAMRGAAHYDGEASYALALSYLATAALLWRFPLVIAGRLVPESDRGASARPDVTDGVTAMFVIVGLLIIAFKALTPLANYVSLLVALIVSGQVSSLTTPGSHIDGLVGAFMLAIGGLFVFKARRLAGRVLEQKGRQ